ncbi:MAG: siderophore-interacting protein, partial [Dehalococcoidia bacterium]
AIPAIGRRLQELRPGVRVFAFVEVADATEEQEFKTATDLELDWLHRSDAKPGTTNLLESAIRAFTFPPGDAYTWAAGEASSMNAVRRHLLDDRGVNKDWMKVRGYWKRGVTDHQEPHSD